MGWYLSLGVQSMQETWDSQIWEAWGWPLSRSDACTCQVEVKGLYSCLLAPTHTHSPSRGELALCTNFASPYFSHFLLVAEVLPGTLGFYISKKKKKAWQTFEKPAFQLCFAHTQSQPLSSTFCSHIQEREGEERGRSLCNEDHCRLI